MGVASLSPELVLSGPASGVAGVARQSWQYRENTY